MKLVLDAGALLALERNDRAMWLRFKNAVVAGSPIVTHGGVVGQVWRGGGPRQARLSTALTSVEVRPLDSTLGRAAGELLAASRTSDVVDAALLLLANEDDHVVTSDADDLDRLAVAAGLDVDVIPV
jgi:hypothetical protein